MFCLVFNANIFFIVNYDNIVCVLTLKRLRTGICDAPDISRNMTAAGAFQSKSVIR